MQEVTKNASAIRYFTAIPRPRSQAILGQWRRLSVTDLSQPNGKSRCRPPAKTIN
jgi:hypothetical protein